MTKAEIRKAVKTHLGQLGYPVEHFQWPHVGRGGRFILLIDDALHTFRVPAPLPKWRFREIMRTIPRRGPAIRTKRLVTYRDQFQPDFAAVWG